MAKEDEKETVDRKKDGDEQVATADADKSKEASGDKAWDTKEQFRSELSAANKRIQERDAQIDSLQGDLGKTQESLTEAQKRLEEIERRMKSDSDDEESFSETDLDDYDNLKKHVVKLVQSVSAQQETIRKQEQALSEQRRNYESLFQERQNQLGQQRINDICAGLDEKYGPEHRNEVLKLVTEKFHKGKIYNIPDVATQQEWISSTLELEYMRRSNSGKGSGKSSPKKADDVSLDTGVGGKTSAARKLKEGSFDEVFAQYDSLQEELDGG